MRIAVYSHSLPTEKQHWKEAEWFVYEVLKRLVSAHAKHDFIWITPYPTSLQDILKQNVSAFPLGKKPANPLSSRIRLRRTLPAILKKKQVDLLLSLGGVLPVLSTPVCSLIEPPFPAGRKFGHLLQKTDSLAVISDADKERLTARYHLASQKIVAVHRGVDERYKPLNWEQREEVKGGYTDGKEYLIYLGAIKAENNILNLLKAFSILKKRLRSNMVLVLAGSLDEHYKAFPELLQTYYFRNDVKWIREITLEERIRLIGAAYGLISPLAPPTLPTEILEAMACRVPAIVADHPLNRETGEEAALYFNPQDVENTGNALCEIYKDEDLRSRLIALGDIQAAKYSWDKTTDLLWSAARAAFREK